MIRRFLKFGVVGLSGAVIFFGILIILVEFCHLDKRLAWFIGAMASILNNFIWNSFYTWPDQKIGPKRKLVYRLVLYYFFTFLATGINYLIYFFLLKVSIHYLVSATIAISVASIFSFSFSHFIVWRKSG